MDAQKYPSPFYQLLEGATSYKLGVPDVDYDDTREEFWVDDGSLRLDLPGTWTWYDIDAVFLGEGRYRFAADNLLCSGLALRWGDEFLAEETSPGCLEVLQVIVPGPFKHWSGIASGPIPSGGDLERRIHDLHGGWMAEAMGLVTVTIPAEHWDEFVSTPPWSQPRVINSQRVARGATEKGTARLIRDAQPPTTYKSGPAPNERRTPKEPKWLQNAVEKLEQRWREPRTQDEKANSKTSTKTSSEKR